MKILLISPSSGNWRHVGKSKVFNGKTFSFSLLSLLSVAAETPPDVDVQIIDEQVDDIPWNLNPDLVGVTCMTALAPRAYEIGDKFRSMGIPVVMGGMHPTFLPEEALEHSDAVVVGEVEGVWIKVLEDVKNEKLKGIYKSEKTSDLSGLNIPPRKLLNGKNYSTVQAAQATRGCPHKCSFCSVSAFNDGIQRKRPVDEVVKEIAGLSDKFFIFVDDNLTADREYAGELFNALRPLNKYWVTQSTLSISEEPDFVKAAADAGCIGIFIGLETFSEDNLNSVDKGFNKVNQYRDAVRVLHSYGIAVEAGIVFGFDSDTPKVFNRTLKILDKIKIDAIQASVLTPLPGTPHFKSMGNRITDYNWSNYDFHHVVFEPAGMSKYDLQAGHDWVTHEFYRPWRIIRRLVRHLFRPHGFKTLPYVGTLNFAYYGRTVKWNIKGWNPEKSKKAKVKSKKSESKIFRIADFEFRN